MMLKSNKGKGQAPKRSGAGNVYLEAVSSGGRPVGGVVMCRKCKKKELGTRLCIIIALLYYIVVAARRI